MRTTITVAQELSVFGEVCKSILATVLFYGLMSWLTPNALSKEFFALFLVGHFLGSMIYRFIKEKLRNHRARSVG